MAKFDDDATCLQLRSDALTFCSSRPHRRYLNEKAVTPDAARIIDSIERIQSWHRLALFSLCLRDS